MEYSHHFLFPSAVFADTSPYRVTTILGSCVAVCLYDPLIRCGGINHYMLPLWNGTGLASPRYGNIAIESLIERMYLLGSQPSRLQAKIFGGASILNTVHEEQAVGNRNIDLARQMLTIAGIRIVAASVGGTQGRKIIFNTYTGEVLHQFLPNSLKP